MTIEQNEALPRTPKKQAMSLQLDMRWQKDV